MRLIIQNYVDSSEVTETSGSDTVENLKTYSREKVFKSNTGGGSFDLKVVLGSQAPVTAIVLGRHNFEAGMVLRIYLYSDTEFNTQKHDSGDITIGGGEAGAASTNWGDIASIPPASLEPLLGVWGVNLWGGDTLRDVLTNFVYWVPEIDQVDTQTIQGIKIVIVAPLEEVEVGRLIIGEYIEPTYTISYGHNISWEEKTKQYRRNGNTLRSNNTPSAKKLQFDLKTINDADNTLIHDSLKIVGMRRDFFVSIYPTDTDYSKLKDYSGIMKLTKIPSMAEYLPSYYKSKYIMEEV